MGGRPEEAISNRTYTLVAVLLSSFLTPLASSSVNVALPAMAREFSMTAISMGWVATSYILTAAAVLVPLGRLADIFGRKKIFLLGTWVFTGASFLLAMARSTDLLICFRVMQGIGGAMIFATGVAMLSLIYPIGQRGRALGLNVAVVYMGLSAGPFLGGILTQHAGWRSIFFLNVPLGLMIIVLGYLKLREEWADAKGEEYDILGAAIYGAVLLVVMLGFSDLPGLRGTLLLAGGVAGIFGFTVLERRAGTPIMDISLFTKNKAFAFSNVAALISYSATFGVGFLLSIYLQHIKGLNPQSTGIILVSQPLVQAIFSPLTGRASDRIEPRFVASAGMAVTAAGLFLLVGIREATPLWFIGTCLCVLGCGFALFSSPNNNAIMSSVDSRLYGVASAMLATMRLIGQMFSMGIAMMLFAVCMGRVEISPAQYPFLLKSIRAAFLVFGLLCTMGIYASFVRGDVRRSGD